MFRVFFSWQSDLPAVANRSLILGALERACAKLRSENGVVVEPIVDRDTLDVTGAVNIAETIFAKILDADAFVGDVSLINTKDEPRRPTPNPNVLLELGYAKRHLGDEAIILVANKHYGGVELLPFDLRGLRTLLYAANPDDAATSEKDRLVSAFTGAITSIAAAVRNDPVIQVILPRTLNVAGQAEGLLGDLAKGAGKQISPRTVAEGELEQVCNSIDPNGQAPLVLGINATGGFRFGNWIDLLWHWRKRSQEFTTNILMFSPFLKREHVALLARVEQCSYFAQLHHLVGQPIRNNNLSWLFGSMWEYVLEARRLREYAETVLARRAGAF